MLCNIKEIIKVILLKLPSAFSFFCKSHRPLLKNDNDSVCDKDNALLLDKNRITIKFPSKYFNVIT